MVLALKRMRASSVPGRALPSRPVVGQVAPRRVGRIARVPTRWAGRGRSVARRAGFSPLYSLVLIFLVPQQLLFSSIHYVLVVSAPSPGPFRFFFGDAGAELVGAPCGHARDGASTGGAGLSDGRAGLSAAENMAWNPLCLRVDAGGGGGCGAARGRRPRHLHLPPDRPR